MYFKKIYYDETRWDTMRHDMIDNRIYERALEQDGYTRIHIYVRTYVGWTYIWLKWCLKEFGSEASLATFSRYFYNVKRRMQITLLEWNNMVENAEDDACANWCCYTDEKQCLTSNLWRSFRPRTFTAPRRMHLLIFSLPLGSLYLYVRSIVALNEFINVARVTWISCYYFVDFGQVHIISCYKGELTSCNIVQVPTYVEYDSVISFYRNSDRDLSSF